MPFTDTKNRTWTIEANVATVKRIKELCGVNVLDLGDAKSNLVRQLHEEPWVLCDILYAALKPAMDEAKVTSDDFGAALGGNSLAAAFEALQEMLVNFSSGGRRDLLTKIFAKSKEVQDLTTDMAMQKLEDPELITRIRSEAAEKLDRLMGSSRDSGARETTPTVSPLESESIGTAGS